MEAVVIGPGRVGCGFAGHLLHRAGFDLCFVGRSASVAPLQRAGEYVVRLTDGSTTDDERVRVAGAIDIADTGAVAHRIASAALVCIAVGPRSLTAVAPLLAEGLGLARRPVNVLAFENVLDAGSRLRNAVRSHLGSAATRRHGFSGAVVSRAVAHRVVPDRLGDPMVFIGEPIDTFEVDGSALAGGLPRIPGMRPTEDFTGAYRCKLYRYSAGHATAAYLGHLKGYRYVHAAVRDPEVQAAVLAAMSEGEAGLCAAYGCAALVGAQGLEAILERFANAALSDTVARVGRDPARKLAREDRLIGAARLAERANVPARVLASAAAAALCFHDGPTPPLAVPKRSHGCDAVALSQLRDLSGLSDADPLARRIVHEWRSLNAIEPPGNLLLSLRSRVWACEADHDSEARAS